jgi:hypothetical protein
MASIPIVTRYDDNDARTMLRLFPQVGRVRTKASRHGIVVKITQDTNVVIGW